MTTIEGNKLIAKFMGILLDPLSNTRTSKHFGGKELAYHTSWDWLMPVVQKIESMGFTISIFKGCCDVEANDKEDFETIQNGGGQPKIFSTWTSITQFITWYNSQHKGVKNT